MFFEVGPSIFSNHLIAVLYLTSSFCVLTCNIYLLITNSEDIDTNLYIHNIVGEKIIRILIGPNNYIITIYFIDVDFYLKYCKRFRERSPHMIFLGLIVFSKRYLSKGSKDSAKQCSFAFLCATIRLKYVTTP